MRADAAELYKRWWPVALCYAARWAPSEADAEDIAASAIVAFIEEAPAGLSDRAIERALSRSISRSRQDAQQSWRTGYLTAVEASEESDPDAETWDRVRRALGSSELALFERATPGATGGAGATGWVAPSRSALTSRRYRAKKRAEAAAMAVDEPAAGPTCVRFVGLIPEVARRAATTEQRNALLEHTRHCEFCDGLLTDRRTVAHRWKIAGALPGFGVLRKFGWRWWGAGSAHPVMATGAAAVALGAAVTVAVVAPALAAPSGQVPVVDSVVATSSTTTLPLAGTTTTTAASANTSTTVPPTTTTTTPATTLPPIRWGVRAQAVAQPTAQGLVPVSIVAVATKNGQADPGDTLTFSSTCGDAQAVTDATGTAAAQMTCTTSSFPVTVTVTDGVGVATQVNVDQT